MKMTITLFSLALAFIGCEQKMAENESPADESVSLPMELAYKGTPRIGSMKNVQTVMEWNKHFSDLNMDVGGLLADTVTFHLADGFEMTASRDSAVAFVSAYAAETSKIDIIYVAAVPVNVVGPNHEWVFSWTDETYSLKNGNVDHKYYHEDYRLEGGKIREVFQYSRKVPAKGLAVK